MAKDKPRADGRRPDQMRPVKITRGFLKYAEGSCLIEVGETKVICAASLEQGVPKWMEGAGRGWVTAEYAMLPRATHTRSVREGRVARPPGRTMEIQRLVGRCLRAVTDLPALGDRRIVVDCDVMQADGGTRTAAVTGGYVALRDALVSFRILDENGHPPLADVVVGVSAGIVAGRPLLDLAFAEDSEAAVDMNCAFTGGGRIVEIQATAEERPFSDGEFEKLMELARQGASLLTRLVTQLFDRDLPSIRTHEGT
ncbi:MAG TPA: ribonuclease PH [bacterium]|nr:ribonuclease PH [bacterium]